jgi:hypothetical protein
MLKSTAPAAAVRDTVPIIFNTLIPKIYTTIFSLYKTVVRLFHKFFSVL